MLSAHHDVVTEGNPAAALARLRGGEPFDAILCDLMMPGLTGMDLHEELSRTSPALAARMGFLSGGAFTTRAQEFVASLPGKHLDKPFSSAALREFVEKLLDG